MEIVVKVKKPGEEKVLSTEPEPDILPSSPIRNSYNKGQQQKCLPMEGIYKPRGAVR